MMTDARHARVAAAGVGVLLLVIYASTAAPMLTFWDASEFATAIGTLGIPHPPGTPVYVALGTTLWHLLPGLSPVQAGSLLSALATATACALAARLVMRITGQWLHGVVAGLCAGLMGTVWLNATETEVYAVSLLCVAFQLVAAWNAHARDSDRHRLVVAYVAAMALALHLSALVAAPAAMLLANTDRDGSIRWRSLLTGGLLVCATALVGQGHPLLAVSGLLVVAVASRLMGPGERWLLPAAFCTLLAWSAVFVLLVRARQEPFLNQGDPDTLPKLLDVIARAQYDVAPLWPRRAPFWLQLGNIAQYADWQVALSLWNDVTPAWVRTPFTALAALLGAIGARAHWRVHRITARVMLVLMLLATVGVCVQLNLRAGPSYGIGVLAPDAIHEARERDYFFALAFWGWGLWIGAGCCALVSRVSRPVLVAPAIPLLMLVGSWTAVTRTAMPDKVMASAMAAEFLRDVPTGAMLFTAGDNDSYPLWYRQAVDSVRTDVQVVVTSLLPANWYFRESASRGLGLTADTTIIGPAVLRAGALARQQLDRQGQVAVTIALAGAQRAEIGRLARITCWRRIGLVEVGTRREVCPPRIHVERAFESAARLRVITAATPRQSPGGMVPAFQRLARCPQLAATAATRGAAALDSTARALLDITCNLR